MLTIEGLKKEHIDAMNCLDIQSWEFDEFKNNSLVFSAPHNYCFLFDGEPVLIIGLFEKWPKCFGTYTFFSKNWNFIYYKTIVKVVKSYINYLEYDRIEHLISVDRPWTDRLVKIFGFEYNCTMRKYFNGKDYKLYEIVS